MKSYPEGTLGRELEYYGNPRIGKLIGQGIDLDFLPTQEELNSLATLRRQTKGVLDFEFDDEIPLIDGDAFLRQQGFYDSNDKRCCVNQKRC